MDDINGGPAWIDDVTIPPRTISGLTAERDAFMEDNAALVACLERTLDRLLEADSLHDCGCEDAACPLCLAYEDVQEALAAHQARGA